jgi:AI-2 transport protein TqsA
MNSPKLEGRVQTICLFVLTTIAVAVSLKLFSSVLIPFVLAIFLTYFLSPLIDVQIKWMRVPRFVAILSTVFLGCVFLVLIGLLVSAAVGQVIAHKDEYLVQMEQLSSKIVSSIDLERFGYDLEQLSESISSIGPGTAGKLLSKAVSEIMNVVSNGLLVLIFTVFMFAGKSSYSSSGDKIRDEIESNIKRYTLVMVLTSGFTGLLVGITLSVLGVDFAWMFGFLAFLLNFIPNIGSVISTLLPIPVIILSPGLSITARILAIAIPTVIQFTIGNLVQPKLFGRSVNLHPVAILLALIFFGSIWGIVGMFLATPITVVLRILLEKFEYTADIANLLAENVDRSGKS